jgi:hypothetical protein
LTADHLGFVSPNRDIARATLKRHPSGGDCFVALRAPRNDGAHQTIHVIASEAKQYRAWVDRE